MDQTSWLQRVRTQFPAITFALGNDFRWSPVNQTIYIGKITSDRDVITLLHEIGHALCSHSGYDQDIKLLTLEREAWTSAQNQVSPLFNITIDEDMVEEALDSYRDWLHARSRCPECNQNGIQQSSQTYTCLLCTTNWKVNDARRCGLKRYRLEATKNTR
jgi:Zn finger protein HypA/HybF involved in hydrogenase expression